VALIIEDGTGVPEADSFIDVLEAQDLGAKYGMNLPDSDTELEVKLRQAYLALDVYEPKLLGERTFEKQTGVFPRIGLTADADEITFNMKLAQMWQVDALVSGSAVNTINTGQKLSGFNVDGVYSETYQEGSTTYTNPIVQGVQNALRPYLRSSAISIGITREFESVIL